MALVPMSMALGCASGGTTSPPPDAMAVASCAQAGCDPAATCDDSTGVAVCACPEGYDEGYDGAAGNGTACVDIDECSTGLHECAPQASCSNRTGSYLCTCASGYAGDGFGCTDIDECAIGNHLCDADAGCENRDGSYACACNDGYSGDGFACTDIDECATGAAGCDFYADCSNLPGSFECACRPGFMGDGFTCIDLDECALGIVTCTGTTVCENLPGSAACACANGYHDENGDASSCLTRGAGRVLLIGHDYSGISSPANALLGNAVFSANTTGTVDILFYTQYADKAPGEEVERSLAAVSERAAQLGRTLTTTELSDYTQLSALLPGKDVLLVLEQELATATNMTTVGQAWALTLQTFVQGGGTVVVTDMSGSTWRILHYSGLMSISSTSTVTASTTLTVREPQSPIGANLPATYGAPIGTRYYASLDGLTLVNDPSGRAIVLMRSMFDECVVIDDFETGSWPSPLWAPSGTQLGTITALAAHDYNFGVRDPSWHYQTSVTAGRPGEKLSAYVRFQSLSGRAYLGMGASRGGTYSLVLAANLGVVSLQDNTDFGFEDLASSSFSFQTNVWYRAEIEYGTGTQASARLFVGTGSVAVVTLNLSVPGLAPGGAAIRGFGGVDIDTVKVCPGS